MFGYAESPFEVRTKNYFLKEQIEADSSHRFIPSHDFYSFVADVNIWKYWKDISSYYHGPGYWADTYLEVRPFSDLRANLRNIFVNGSTSYGYNQTSYIRSILGVTWTPDILPVGWNFMMRFFDLDRETMGSGLFFEDREMSGLLLQVHSDQYFFKLRLPGTGVLQKGGDLWSHQFRLRLLQYRQHQ